MKHTEVISLSKALLKVKNLNGFEAKIKILKNKKALEKEVSLLQEMEKELIEKRKFYDIEIQDIYKEISEGKTKVVNETEVFDIAEEKLPLIREKITKINSDNKEFLDSFSKEFNDFQKHLLETDSDFKPNLIPVSLLEKYDSTLSQEELELIEPLIDFDK